MDHLFDLSRLAARINARSPFEPTLECLADIQKGFSTNVPFENLDVLLNQAILLDPEALEEKLVVRRRGGYCFELNGFLLHLLRQIGFEASPLSARIRLGTERGFTPPRTHVFLKVEVDAAAYIVDSGLGALSLTAPIRLVEDIEQSTPHETRRIVREGDVFYHQALLGQAWADVYEFTGEEMPLIDRQIAHWFTSTSPQSKFRQGVRIGMARSNGERIGLLDSRFTHRRGAEILRQVEIGDPDDLLNLLSREFSLNLPSGTRLIPAEATSPVL